MWVRLSTEYRKEPQKMKFPKNITAKELMKVDYHYSYSEEELKKDWSRLKDTTEYKTGAQFKPGLKLCQHFFRNFFLVEDKNGKSFEKCWNDEEVMKKVLKWANSGDGSKKGISKLWLSWVRRAVYLAAGLPNSTYYRPHFAKQIIEMTGKPTGTLFDPCAGWGGRLLGTVASGWKYIGCDTDKVTYGNLLELVKFLGIEEKVTLYNDPPIQDSMHLVPKVDVVLTSPPFYNLENYDRNISEEYSTYEMWSSEFLKPLVEKSLKKLKAGGLSCWNVMNCGGNDLVGDIMEVHKSANMKLKTTLCVNSPLANIRTLKNKDVTYIFEKKG